jgi:hypothetical protein
MSALLQEIVSVYPLLAPPSLTAHASNRVCNALALLQCVASHNDTRSLFLSAHIPLFLYPFLNTTSKTRPFEYLRLTSLGVIGALVKQNDNSDVINFLLSTEIIPLCLRIMETGSELSKTVAIFIVQKILLDEVGLSYICQVRPRPRSHLGNAGKRTDLAFSLNRPTSASTPSAQSSPTWSSSSSRPRPSASSSTSSVATCASLTTSGASGRPPELSVPR